MGSCASLLGVLNPSVLPFFSHWPSGYTGPLVRKGGGSRKWLCKVILQRCTETLFNSGLSLHRSDTSAVLRPHKQQLTPGTSQHALAPHRQPQRLNMRERETFSGRAGNLSHQSIQLNYRFFEKEITYSVTS